MHRCAKLEPKPSGNFIRFRNWSRSRDAHPEPQPEPTEMCTAPKPRFKDAITNSQLPICTMQIVYCVTAQCRYILKLLHGMRFDEVCVITFFAVFTCILCREFEQTRKIVVQIGTRAFQFLLEVRYLIADPCMADPLSRCQPPSKFLATPLSSYPQNSVFLTITRSLRSSQGVF